MMVYSFKRNFVFQLYSTEAN